jgi:hypothetical protein
MMAAMIGATVGLVWMYLAGAALAYGVSFSTLWNLAAYITCPVIILVGLRFWPVILGNSFIYFACTWIVFDLVRRKKHSLQHSQRVKE